MGKEAFKSPVGRLAVRFRRGIALPLPISAAPPFYSPAAGRERNAMAGTRDPSQQLSIRHQDSLRSAHLGCSGSKRVAVDFIRQDWAWRGVHCENANTTPLDLAAIRPWDKDGRRQGRSRVGCAERG